MTNISIDLNDLYLFAQVVQRRGFTAAGDAIGIPKSRISRRIAMLESSLGTRLLQRNTRSLSLTDAGQALYLHCESMIASAYAGEMAVRAKLSVPSGRVRLSIPVELSNSILAKILSDFMQLYPLVKLEIQVTNRLVNLLEEQFDIVVRGVGIELESSSLIQAHLYNAQWGLVASPHYLSSIGEIDSPKEILNLDFLIYSSLEDKESNIRLLNSEDEAISLTVNARMHSDNITVLKQAAIDGLGVAGLPLYACQESLKNGSLQRVLPNWKPKKGQIVVLFPSRTGQVPAVRLLVDYLKLELPKNNNGIDTI